MRIWTENTWDDTTSTHFLDNVDETNNDVLIGNETSETVTWWQSRTGWNSGYVFFFFRCLKDSIGKWIIEKAMK